eukprot:scaffold2830_cov395-Prasinococcus_capsulatus_cf.AAC.1
MGQDLAPPRALLLPFDGLASPLRRGGHARLGEGQSAYPCSSQMTSQNLAPIWLPHWPPWIWTISLMVSVWLAKQVRSTTLGQARRGF